MLSPKISINENFYSRKIILVVVWLKLQPQSLFYDFFLSFQPLITELYLITIWNKNKMIKTKNKDQTKFNDALIVDNCPK